jgi:hypothetical protein
MKTFPILERRATWVCLLATLPLMPVVAMSFPRLGLLKGFQQMSRNEMRAAQRTGKGDISEDFKRALDLKKVGEKRVLQLLDLQHEAPELAYLEPMRALGAFTDAQLGAWAADYMKVAARGQLSARAFGADNHGISSEFEPAYLRLSVLQKYLKESAAWAIAGRETSSALVAASRLAQCSDPIPGGTAQITTRADAMLLVEELIHREESAPTSETLTALDAASMADVNPLSAISTYMYADDWAREHPWQAIGMEHVLEQRVLAEAGWNLANDMAHFERPENIRWAKHVQRVAAARGPFYAENPLLAGGLLEWQPWTAAPALAARFHHIVRTENSLLPDRMNLGKIADKVDRDTVAYFAYGMLPAPDGGGETYRLIRCLETYRVALKAAVAARDVRHRTGEWPTSVERLASDYGIDLPTTGALSTLNSAKVLARPGDFPYGPIKLERVMVTRRNAARILGLQQPIHRGGSEPWNYEVFEESVTSDTFRAKMRLRLSGDSREPIRVLGLAQKLRGMAGIEQVRVSPEELKFTRALRASFYEGNQLPEVLELFKDAGTTVPVHANATPLMPPAPGVMMIEATIQLPAEVFAVVFTPLPQRAWNESQLEIYARNNTGDPEGHLLVCPMPWDRPEVARM